ncbi:hypothetical protein BG004_003437 [Podila humilis]|nr:hypothetical protein BG004_003437 [Podila humilis]
MGKLEYSLLPTAADPEPATTKSDVVRPSDPPVYSSAAVGTECEYTRRRQRLRIGFFKLCLVGMVVYMLFSPSTTVGLDEDERQDGIKAGQKHPHRYNRQPTHKVPIQFEKHMNADVEKLIAGSLESSIVWDRLAEMTDTFGHRLVGSDSLEKSIDWILKKARTVDNLTVSTEEVVVDYWQRHEESLYFLSPSRGPVKLHMLGIGYSVPTPDPVNGLEAEILVVHSKDKLDNLGQQGLVKGKVVVWNKKFERYGKDNIYRAHGAAWAQEHGAIASLTRSLGPFSLQTPHTGAGYGASIPMASISSEDADLLERTLRRHQQDPVTFPEWPRVKLTMGATTELNAKISRNVIFEIKGRENPEQIVLVGGHIDSWDVGVGALDDGAGCFIAWETIRQLARLERPPRRTVRVVLWTSEENTSVGGVTYAKNHPETEQEHHVFAMESDIGVFDPYGIAYTPGRPADTATDTHVLSATEYLQAAGEMFLGPRKDLGYKGAGRHVLPDGSGADIAPICKQGVACVELISADPFPLPFSTSPYAIGRDENKKEHHHRKHPGGADSGRRPGDSGYFYYHHTEADTMGVFTPEQLQRSAAVMAFWTYIAAESAMDF